MLWRFSIPVRGALLTAGFLPAVLASVFVLPAPLSGQTVFGDPSAPIGEFGSVRVGVEGVGLTRHGLRFAEAPAPVVLGTRNLSPIAAETTDNMEAELVLLTVGTGFGSAVEVFGAVGSARIDGDGFGSKRSLAGGGGVRFSPPQDGWLRYGAQAQVFRASGTDDQIAAVLVIPDASPGEVDEIGINASTSGNEKISFTRYDVMVGAGVHRWTAARPYGGALFSVLRGGHQVAVSGMANYITCPRVGGTCSGGTEPFSMTLDHDVESEKALGAVAGVAIRPLGRVGFTVEGRFLSQTTYAFAAHIRL